MRRRHFKGSRTILAPPAGRHTISSLFARAFSSVGRAFGSHPKGHRFKSCNAQSSRPKWRNGIRAGFKNRFPSGSEGSSPSFGSFKSIASAHTRVRSEPRIVHFFISPAKAAKSVLLRARRPGLLVRRQNAQDLSMRNNAQQIATNGSLSRRYMHTNISRKKNFFCDDERERGSCNRVISSERCGVLVAGTQRIPSENKVKTSEKRPVGVKDFHSGRLWARELRASWAASSTSNIEQ